MECERIFLEIYPIDRKRVGKVYWVAGEPHRPVEIDIVRVGDGAVLLTLRKGLNAACDIEEVGQILRHAGKLEKPGEAHGIRDDGDQ